MSEIILYLVQVAYRTNSVETENILSYLLKSSPDLYFYIRILINGLITRLLTPCIKVSTLPNLYFDNRKTYFYPAFLFSAKDSCSSFNFYWKNFLNISLIKFTAHNRFFYCNKVIIFFFLT